MINFYFSDISSPEQTIYRMQSFNSLDNYNRRLTRQRSLPELIMRRFDFYITLILTNYKIHYEIAFL